MQLTPLFFRGLMFLQCSLILSAIILVVLFFVIFFSFVLPTPTNVLKRIFAVSAWIVAPSALLFAWMAYHGFNAPKIIEFVPFLWLQVFASLWIGGLLRRQIFPSLKSPDPLSLPFAALVVLIFAHTIVYLFVQYGLIDQFIDCSLTSNLEFSICLYSDFETYYFFAIFSILLISLGIALPANSNLVRANDWLAVFIKYHYARARNAIALQCNKWREQRQHYEEERARRTEGESPNALVGPPSYPVPAIIERPSFEAMCLKLRRSQRSGFTGNRIFALDARIELTAEERSLVEKYQLGNTVIYDSVSRQRHTAAMLAHAEATRDQPSLYAGPVTQLLGLGKALYRLSRAGVSATAAAFSLRVTIYSLMRGVHVECKSMEELLAAESAVLEGARNLKFYLETAATFDGREEIVEL